MEKQTLFIYYLYSNTKLAMLHRKYNFCREIKKLKWYYVKKYSQMYFDKNN